MEKERNPSLAAQRHGSHPVYILERDERERIYKKVNKAEFLVLRVELPNTVVILLSRKP